MKRIFRTPAIILFAALLAAPLASAAGEPSGSGPARAPESLAKAGNTFAAQLYKELSPRAGNLFFSPYSISNALGMAYAGARGATAEEIRNTLHFPADQAILSKDFKEANRDLMRVAEREGLALDIANGLFLTGSPVSKEFEATLRKDYDAELFSDGLAQINAWVGRKTHGKIEKILDRLSPDSVCVILNAIYFKGLWKRQFSMETTRNAPFSLSSNRKATVPLMYRKGRYKLLGDKDFQAVSIPYGGDDLSMVILLPRETNGLAGLEKRLSGEKLDAWMDELERQPSSDIDLYLPKFTMETGYDLKPPLMRMGMRAAFGKGADFSAVGPPKGRLWIGQVEHRVFLKVDEQGTEAAAATAGEMMASAVRKLPVFRADHPFFFLIRDDRSSMILFMGRVVDPTSKR